MDARRLLGRGLTAGELERMLQHYPGDLPEHADTSPDHFTTDASCPE
jgi:hypothetical protein